MDGVGVKERKEGRKKKPHLAYARRKGQLCLKFGGYLVGAMGVVGVCLVGVWRVSEWCLEGV